MISDKNLDRKIKNDAATALVEFLKEVNYNCQSCTINLRQEIIYILTMQNIIDTYRLLKLKEIALEKEEEVKENESEIFQRIYNNLIKFAIKEGLERAEIESPQEVCKNILSEKNYRFICVNKCHLGE